MNETEKKCLWKRPLPYILLLAALALAALLCLGGRFLRPSDTQKLNLAGYTIEVPGEWSIRLENEIAVFYAEDDGEPIGKARLINQETTHDDFGKWFYFETAPLSEKDSVQGGVSLCEQAYGEGDETLHVFVFSSLPNPQPYHFAMYFNDAVSKRTTRRIVKSFFVPDPGKNPPPKNIPAPTEEEAAAAGAVYVIHSDEQTTVHNTARLEDFAGAFMAKTAEPTAFSMFSYTRWGNLLAMDDSWYYLDFDGEQLLLYQYYQTNSGTYIYNNNPQKVETIERTADETLTSFVVNGGTCIFEYPTNPYREQSDALYPMQATVVGDNSGVGAILDSLPAPGLARKSFSLQTETEPYGITIEYTVLDYEQAYSDGKLNRAPLEKNAAVIFSLVENADIVTVNVTNDGKKESARFTRKKAEEYFEADVRSFAKEPQEFRQYMEDVQNMPPAEEEPEPKNQSSASGGVLGEVVFSTTVTIPHGMLVTHPRTGEKVVVDPYAERYGYAQYLGKPISCVIYRTSNGYRAVATCGGAVLGEYAMANDREKDYVIGMIHSYGG